VGVGALGVAVGGSGVAVAVGLGGSGVAVAVAVDVGWATVWVAVDVGRTAVGVTVAGGVDVGGRDVKVEATTIFGVGENSTVDVKEGWGV